MRVLTLGTFDLFHDGHRYLLTRASRYGELWVGVNSDRFVRDYKGRLPERDQAIRIADVRTHPCAPDDQVLLNDGPGRDLIERVRPGLIVIGGDWLEHDYLAQIGMSRSQLEDLRCDVLFVQRVAGHSTTSLRRA